MNKVIVGLVTGGFGALIGGGIVHNHWYKKYFTKVDEFNDYLRKSAKELEDISTMMEEANNRKTDEFKESIKRAREVGVPEDKILKSEEDLRRFLES